MKKKITAKNYDNLKEIIEQEIKINGNKCDLNHINVSRIKDMSYLFAHESFNGNISE